jgi:pimeloyl-ACP methyl ester carboxylesterase
MMGFSMGGYVAAAFAARYPELLAGVLLGACAHDAHTFKWQLVGKMAEAVYAVCSYKTKSQVTWRPDWCRMTELQLCTHVPLATRCMYKE